MDTNAPASAAVAPVAPASLATQPTVAPAPESTQANTPIADVAPTNATPTKTANDIVLASGDELATRYGIKEIADASAPAEPVSAEAGTGTEGAPVTTEPTPGVETPAATNAANIITQPITPFEFYDDEGALEIPANVKIGFKAGGKDYKDLRLDEVVRMAQQAPMAEKHRQDAEQLKPIAEQAQQIAQQYQQLQAEFAQNNALYEQMLSHPELYQEAASQYQAQNSPDQRLARLQAESRAQATQHQQQLQQLQLQQTTAAAKDFTATRIAPSIEALTTQYPQLADDVMAKFHELTAPLMAPSPTGGVWVPPNRLGELEASVLPALRAWADGKASKSAAMTQAATQAAQAQTRKAQTDAQQAKRQLARPLTPTGAKVTPDVPAPPKIRTSSDAVEASLARVAAQIRGAA